MTDKKQVSNGEECRQKHGRTFFIVPTAIHNHSLIIVDTVLLENNNENTFYSSCFPTSVLQKHIFT